MFKSLRDTVLLVLSAFTGCKDSPTSTGVATVRYKITSALCGGTVFTMLFSADSTALGTELLTDRQSSKEYTVPFGRHVVGAYVQNWHKPFDTVVVLAAGQTFVRDIDLYCS